MSFGCRVLVILLLVFGVFSLVLTIRTSLPPEGASLLAPQLIAKETRHGGP